MSPQLKVHGRGKILEHQSQAVQLNGVQHYKLTHLVMTRACVRLSILLASSSA